MPDEELEFDPQGTEIEPQPGPQTILLAATDCQEVFFGGALMAGKSYALGLALEAQHQRFGGAVSGIIIRQSVPELDDLIKTFQEILEPFGWNYLIGKKTFKHPDGAECRMRHLEVEKDIKKYWGHQYCVGKGTPILMADGTYLAIEDVKVGDMVMTLEGPKPVTGLMAPTVAACVLAEVFDKNGVKLGEQIQPSKHPLLSSVSESSEHSHHQSQSDEQSLQQISQSWSSYLSLLDERQASLASGASSEDGRTCCKESEHSNSNGPRLQQLSCPVVLHEPSVQLSLSRFQSNRMLTPKQYCSQHRWLGSFEQPGELTSLKQLGQQLPCEPSQSLLSSCAYSGVGDTSCALPDLEIASNCRHHCSSDLDRCDALLLRQSDISLASAPSEVDVAVQDRDGQQLDDRGNIQLCSHLHSRAFAYIHPYTAMQRDVTETIQIGSCVLTPAGEHQVYDLCVADANHYITAAGVINKNSFMGIDEMGDMSDKTFQLIQRLRAARLRSPKGVKVQFVATGNPCGAGHKNCKERYIDPAPPFTPFKDPRSKHNMIFIPGKMENNIKALLGDPEYKERCKSLGPDWYVNALINGDWTISPEGNMFHREWFDQRYKPNELPEFLFKCISWDTAFKTTKDSAESAATVWGVTKDRFYLLDAYSEKLEFPELKQKGEDLYNAHLPIHHYWIEDKASGPSMAQSLKKDTRIPVKTIKVDVDKQRRAFVVTPLFESRKIFLPVSAPWVDKYIDQLCSFPAPTGFADLVDSTSQALTQIQLVLQRMTRHSTNVVPLPKSLYGV